MKRKRQEDEEEENETKKTRKSKEWMSVRSKKLTLANLFVLHDFLGPLCIEVLEKKAVPEAECSQCKDRREYEDLPRTVQEMIKDQGYLMDALVRELFHRNPGTRAVVRPGGLVFEDVRHIPWFAIQIILFKSPPFKVYLDMNASTTTIEWKKDTAESSKTSTVSEVKDFLNAIEDMSLRKSLEEFLK